MERILNRQSCNYAYFLLLWYVHIYLPSRAFPPTIQSVRLGHRILKFQLLIFQKLGFWLQNGYKPFYFLWRKKYSRLIIFEHLIYFILYNSIANEINTLISKSTNFIQYRYSKLLNYIEIILLYNGTVQSKNYFFININNLKKFDIIELYTYLQLQICRNFNWNNKYKCCIKILIEY